MSYLDEIIQETTKIKRKRGLSMSNHINKTLKKSNEDRPPELMKLLGSWENDPMEVPEDLPWSLDIKRKSS